MKTFGIFEKLYNRVVDEEEMTTGNDEEELEVEEAEEEEGDPEEDEEDNTSAETAQALQLFKALQSPDTAPGMMAFLNAQLAAKGLAPVTKSDLKDISVSDILKEGFGEEYSFLNDKLGPAFEKAMNKLVDAKIGNSLKNLEDSNTSLRNEIAATKISNALDPIIEEMGADEFDKIAPALAKTMERYPNNANLPMKKYIKDMLDLTVKSKNTPANTEKIRKNVREARRNLAPGANHSTVKNGSKTPTIREAVQAAMRGEKFED